MWNDINTIYYAACKKHHSKWIMCEAKMSMLRLIQNVLLYSVLIYMIMFRGMSISNFVLYIGLVAAFSTAMTDLFCNLVWMNMNRMQLDDFRTFMDWTEEIPNYQKGEGTINNIKLEKYEFKFENVSFKYPGHDKFILKNLNLTIEAGSKLAIVGINGAGKTTLTKLLMRLYEPTEGRILLNGVDIKQFDRESYFNIFAPVFQNIEIFAFPVWQNISMKSDNETDRDKVMETLKRSDLDEKINRYENKIDTKLLRIIDPDGVDLSGGERQRLAMARALYSDRDVLVLDEPTAALDALAEDKMYQEFNEMVKGKTAIFISHRLSSTRFCDKIVMFEDGKIIEEGTHDELMKTGGKYSDMFKIQAQYYKSEKEGVTC
jgi:ATP-binding cassette subfamily B protein